jgi:hypothetical protein
MWKVVRISVLLLVLAVVALQAWQDNAAQDWTRSFHVVVYPVNVDRDANVATYIQSLQAKDFEPVAEFFAEEGAHFKLELARPIELTLGEEIQDVPPVPPQEASAPAAIWWSLRFRWFAWAHSPGDARPDVRLYLLFHDPRKHRVLGHSTALAKGRIGRVNQFGRRDYHDQNLVILAHELLHTLKATDKYDLQTTLPIHPDGYAEPSKSPRYPQEFAELMGGRVPINEKQAAIPANLGAVLIGETTAREIGWVR